MKKVFAALLLAAMPFGAFAQGITGSWNGTLEVGAQQLRLVFNITENDGIYEATMDSPDQGQTGIPTTATTFIDGRLHIEADALHLSYSGELKGDVIEGLFTQMGMSYPMELRRGEVKLSRPQTPVPPFPYNSEDVTFVNREAGITLAGTFTYPAEGSGFPAVVLLSGTGPQDRNEEIIGHKPFLLLADHLARHGIAVLRFDDRGVGGSEGNFASAAFRDFASDGSAGVDYLKGRPEVDTDKIGVIGHSGGGSQAIIIAADRDDVAFIVMMAGVAVRGDLLMSEQRRLIAEAAGVTEEAWRANEELVAKIQSVIDTHGPEAVSAAPQTYIDEILPPAMQDNEALRSMLSEQLASIAGPEMQSIMKFDPTDDLGRIEARVLALNGEKDLQVPADMNFEALHKYMGDRAETRKYPSLNHLFQHTETGNIMEYGTLEETMSPEVLDDIAEWINGIFD